MAKLLIASTNRGKLVEIEAILQEQPPPAFKLNLLLPSDLGIELTVEEHGQTYAENAAIKARAYCRASSLVTLADDSGLEVDCLNGAPGLHSARYSPHPGASDADRRALLLENLRGLPRPWTARFRCTVAIATPEGGLFFADGQVRGEIIPEERGENGFGYDPIFLIPELGLTTAELTMAEKNRLSHRARAVKSALPGLYALYE